LQSNTVNYTPTCKVKTNGHLKNTQFILQPFTDKNELPANR